MDWCRLWHEMPNDPKFQLVAHKANVSVADVLGVYVHMMVNASQAEERGTLEGWNDEVVEFGLAIETGAVERIRQNMQGLLLDDDRLKGWDKRQPKREREDNSTDRVRKYRESKKKQEDTGGVTDGSEPCNAMKRHETPRNTQIRGEEIREDSSVDKSTDVPSPDPTKVAFDAGVQLLTSNGQTEKQARALIGKWRKQSGDEGVIQALGRAQRAGATEPVSFIEGCLKPRDGPKRQWKEAV